MNRVKNLFGTPKKAILSAICIAAILAILCVGTMFTAGAVAKSSSIGTENAQNFAFADAGIDPVSAQIIRTKFDFEHGKFVYDVEFFANGAEYEYLINASDGTVLKRDIDIKVAPNAVPNPAQDKHQGDPSVSNEPAKQPQPKKQPQQPTQPQQSTAAAPIELQAAKNKALADAGVPASSAVFTKQRMDYDDGIQVYDIEFYTSTHEYEYEINAATGAIHDKSVEALKRTQTQKPIAQNNTAGNSDTNIGIDKAKSIAAGKAGFSVAEITFKKAKLERDDGRFVYEIEFYKNEMEYECTIDAASGAILEYDNDYRD